MYSVLESIAQKESRFLSQLSQVILESSRISTAFIDSQRLRICARDCSLPTSPWACAITQEPEQPASLQTRIGSKVSECCGRSFAGLLSLSVWKLSL